MEPTLSSSPGGELLLKANCNEIPEQVIREAANSIGLSYVCANGRPELLLDFSTVPSLSQITSVPARVTPEGRLLTDAQSFDQIKQSVSEWYENALEYSQVEEMLTPPDARRTINIPVRGADLSR